MIRIFQIALTVMLVSTYFFSFGFTFLPENINTKIILAGVGVVLLFGQMIQNQNIQISLQLFGATALAFIFSLVSFFAADVNSKDDFSYATYFMSFALWLLASYTVVFVIKRLHGYADLRLLTYYLAAASVMQCVLALCIDNFPSMQYFIDRYIEQGQAFVQEVDRLYGVGAALDNAGVRFAVVLVLLSAMFGSDLLEKKKWSILMLLLGTFFTILVLGSSISRTTSIGGAIGLTYMFFGTGLFNRVINKEFLRFFSLLFVFLLVAFVVATYFYETNPMFKEYMRFAFEGFFNYFEKGEWRTASTDKLDKNMWVWPTDTKTWLIGSGLFGDWIYSTDIGYCRFILYCGLTGFGVFAAFFVFNAMAFMKKYPVYRWLFLMLLLLTFVIWVKVSTDIFLIYALFYCVEGLQGSLITIKINSKNENNLFHFGNI